MNTTTLKATQFVRTFKWHRQNKKLHYCASLLIWMLVGADGFPAYSSPANYGTNLWLEANTTTNNQFVVILHNTTNSLLYDVLYTTDLRESWIFSEPYAYGGWPAAGYPPNGWGYIFTGDPNTNKTVLSPLPMTGNMFFRAIAGPAAICFYWGDYSGNNLDETIIRPASTNAPCTNVIFHVAIDAQTHTLTVPLTVYYQVSGSAVAGIDYSNNLSGTTIIPAGAWESAPICITALYNTNTMFGDVFVTLRVVGPPPGASLGYVFAEPDYMTATVVISNLIPVTLVTNFGDWTLGAYADGIAYNPIQNALVVSTTFPTNTFLLVGTNIAGALTVTNWANVTTTSAAETEVATVKTSTYGFVQGETFFGDGAFIDKLSANGSVWFTNWCELTNATVTDHSGVVGLCMDDSGSFGGCLIACTRAGCVWLINAEVVPTWTGGRWSMNVQAVPILLTNLPVRPFYNTYLPLLGGVISLTNDVNKWGPWAGKIITGDTVGTSGYNNTLENHFYSIDTNGVVITYDPSVVTPDGEDWPPGIAAENFAVIPPNQDLYFIDALNNNLMKISKSALAPYVGDLLITQTAAWGEGGDYGPPAALFIIAWDQKKSVFKHCVIQGPGILEDAAFAPLDLPSK